MTMPIKNDPAHQAAIWVSRLNTQTLSDAQLQALYQWLQQSPANKREFDALQQVWDEFGAVQLEPELLRHAHPRRSRKFVWYSLAATFTLICSMSLFFFWPVQTPQPIVRYNTEIGEQRHITLPDGSDVQMNTNSSLLVDFSGPQRRIMLDKGEAFFSVTRDPKRPFSVQTGSQSISVLGTRFNVRKRGNQFTVAVEEGIVAVHRKEVPLQLTNFKSSGNTGEQHGQYRLLAGEVMTFADDSYKVSASEPTNLSRQLNWRSGVVTFEDTPLKEVVAELNRYSPRRILIQDPHLMHLKVSGVFHLQQLEHVLSGLQATFALQIRYENDMIFIEKNKQ
ncbi:FecR family protein [Bowmanella denitrificans]|uniref:FecR family protein n=1 Tax=Bowmanella denitrificans TaxID=366582 RepID=UPI000C99DBC7|nr:FecR family protein [Bowmanella denitrificans]